jgi:hypothetical protein
MRRILRKLVIREISGVDFPAATPARAVIMKRQGRMEKLDMSKVDTHELALL